MLHVHMQKLDELRGSGAELRIDVRAKDQIGRRHVFQPPSQSKETDLLGF